MEVTYNFANGENIIVLVDEKILEHDYTTR